MATKIGYASTVSYGIGVQNRYSAFLDDEDAIGLPITHVKQVTQKHQGSKAHATPGLNSSSKSNSGNQASNAAKSASRNPAVSSNQRAQVDLKAKTANELNNQQKAGHADSQRRQQKNSGPQLNGANHSQGFKQQQQSNIKKNRNNSQENAANKFSRNDQQQVTGSAHQGGQVGSTNKENQDWGAGMSQGSQNHHDGKFGRGQHGNRRQFQPNDEKKNLNNQVNNHEDGPVAASSNEDHKRRRQQKRAIDLKHKDPVKRETRRQQVSNTSGQGPAVNGQVEPAQNSKVDNAGPKNFRYNRRETDQNDGSRANQDDPNRGFKGRRGNRSRPSEQQEGASKPSGEQRAADQEGGQPRGNRNRPPRNRNGFGTGSRNNRGPRAEDKSANSNMERQKPIPNFSDKLDFPSLAS